MVCEPDDGAALNGKSNYRGSDIVVVGIDLNGIPMLELVRWYR